MITFHPTTGVFHLSNDALSLVLALQDDGAGHQELIMPYFGGRLDQPERVLQPIAWVPFASFDSARQVLPYACPTDGRGDFRPCMLRIEEESGQIATELFYSDYRIVPGKPSLEGLPSTYVEAEDEAETLTVDLRDARTGLLVQLSYTMYRDLNAVTASCRLVHEGSRPLKLQKAASVALSLDGSYDMLHLHGGWAKERQVERVKAGAMTRSISSVRGASGHEHNPFVALLPRDSGEQDGPCYGVNLIYSGDFEISVDENGFQGTRLLAGIHDRHFSWHLAPGESFQTPEAVLVYSDKGLNGMSQTFHDLFRSRLCRGVWRDRERPILVNNWEGTYFDFTTEKILSIAKAGRDLGVELFVLDDGWFGRRNDDRSSLGDWKVNEEKLPGGLSYLSDRIHEMGMMFGLWFEPEMISPDSDLYRAHPDWCLHAEGRMRYEMRYQLILDFSRKDVQDAIIEAVSSVLSSANINYVKWDMNRNFAEAGSACLTDGREGETAHRYILGVYRVMKEITERFPEILFESCSGGGGRFDAGILAYMPQTWTSDDTDAVERLRIQYGTSYAYPASAMGAHVSAVPNHQVRRTTSCKMRCEVALGGNFGLELDLTRLSDEDREEIRAQIARIKEIRNTTAKGTFTRLLSPWEGDLTAYQFVDDQKIVFCCYRTLIRANEKPLPIRLRNLKAGERYQDAEGKIYTANDLMHFGILPRMEPRDFSSYVLVLTKI